MALPFAHALLVLMSLGGCDPHDAEVTGSYAMYFAEATSENIGRLRQDVDPPVCEYEQSDPNTPKNDIEEDKIFTDECYKQKVEIEKQFQADWDLTPLDCRSLSDYNAIELRDAIIPGWDTQYEAQCCAESWDDDSSNDPDGDMLTTDDCTLRSAPYLYWLSSYSMYVDNKPLETWREEVVMTSEGDLQLTIHVDTRFGDFRTGWVIDPDFQPTQCVEKDGEAVLQELDGNWVEGWSNSNQEDADEGYLTYFLNAGTFQLNPSNTGDYWIFDEDWYAGAGFGRFGDETFYLYSTDYMDPEYTPLWVAVNDEGGVTGGYGNYGTEVFEELECGGGDDSCNQFSDYPDFVQMLKDNANNGGYTKDDVYVDPIDSELERYGLISRDDQPFKLKVEDNSWRPTEAGQGSNAVGFDNWAGLNPSWVRLKTTQEELAKIEPGTLEKPIEGDFQLYLFSSSTASVLVVNGSFTINNVAKDQWGWDATLDEEKRAENSTPTCGE